MKRKNLIKKFVSSVLSAAILFSGAAVCWQSSLQQPTLVAEAKAGDDYCDGIVLRAPKGKEVYMVKGVEYYSPKKNYVCVFQKDGNFVVYRNRPWEKRNSWEGRNPEDAVWATKTYGHSNATCVLQKDGNFVIYGYDSRGFRKCLYTSLTVDKSNKVNAELHLSRRGNLYITHNGKEVWSTKDPAEQKYRYLDEPQWVEYVGEWRCDQLINGLTNSDNKITIDFPQNGKMKVHLYHCTNQFQDVDWYIDCNSITENGSGSKKYSVKLKRNLIGANDYIDADPVEKQMYLGENGETITLGLLNKFHRIYSY